jgi:ubiquinone/menaquinone biosynthesis C-methylase UbiE
MIQNAFNLLNKIIMGERPFNTIFSFNYHNISHIVKFLIRAKNLIESKDNVLVDIGGGDSPYYQILQDIVKTYVVIDLDQALPKKEERNIQQIVGVAEELPLHDKSVDIVLSNQVLEHVMNVEKAVTETYRILKYGGYFIGSVPHICPIHLEPYDFRRFTFFGLKMILSENGFKEIRIEGNGGVHKAAALMVTMDWVLSKYKEGKNQRFHNVRHLALFPIIGCINLFAIFMDYLIGDKNRTPSNYCWIARK